MTVESDNMRVVVQTVENAVSGELKSYVKNKLRDAYLTSESDLIDDAACMFKTAFKEIDQACGRLYEFIDKSKGESS